METDTDRTFGSTRQRIEAGVKNDTYRKPGGIYKNRESGVLGMGPGGRIENLLQVTALFAEVESK